MKHRWIIIAALILGVAIVSVWNLWPLNNDNSTTLKPDNEHVVALGEPLYRELCAECHGKNLEGEPNWRTRDSEGYLPAPPHDESGHTWHHTDELLFRMTKQGIGNFAGPDYKTRMPAYAETLSNEEIVAVLSYIKSRWPEQIRKRHDQMNQAAKGQK